MTERVGAIICCRIPDAKIINYLNDKERGRHYLFVRVRRPPISPHSSPDATILYYLDNRERGGANCNIPQEDKYIRILLPIL